MISDELQKAIDSYELYIKKYGITEDAINAYVEAAKVAIMREFDIPKGLEITARVKELIEGFVIASTGGNVWDLEKYAFANKAQYNILDKYYDVLLLEAQNKVVDSYFRFIERRREPKERFYMPRRKQFLKIGLTQALQGMIDDEYDMLLISLPPGTGKLLADDTPVLTTKGWKDHGDLVIGDYVYGLDGKAKQVQRVFPKDKADVLITFSNGEKIQCHENHEWVLVDNELGGIKTIETKELFNQLSFCDCNGCHGKWFLPFREKINEMTKELLLVSITDIERVTPKQGNCIQVEDGVYCVGKTCIPTHNSTIEKFLHSAIIGWFPRDYNLFYSHSGDITRMYYDGIYDIVSNSDEYAWNDVFPKLKITSTNAKLEQFNVGKYKPFPSVQCTSVGAKNAGKVRCSKFLLVDDMIGGIEEALNPNALDKLWGKYSVDARQRKVQDTDGKNCKEIHIATRWSVNDVIGRIIRMYENNPRVKIISVPDIDAKTGESNFDFEYGGFTKEFFADQQLLMDDISYQCLYKQQPIEREGLLFPNDKIRRYMSLPHGEPERITAQCDTKGKGTDFFVLPVLQKYGDDYYCVDCVCDNTADYEMQYENASNVLVNNKVQECEFERNSGGDRVAMEVNKRVNEKGWICNITDVPTETNKEARIFQCSSWILQHIIFKDESLYSPKEPYGIMMSMLRQYSVTGKNKNDDVPDVFSNFALRMERKSKKRRTVIIESPI